MLMSIERNLNIESIRGVSSMSLASPPVDVRKSGFSSDTGEEGETDLLRLAIDRFFLASEAH